MTRATPQKELEKALLSRNLILHALEDILGELRRQNNSRETALAIARLQEAIMWLKEALNGVS